MKKVLLAYSGGLVNSVSIHWLRYQRGYRVVTFTADVGQGGALEDLTDLALEMGADSSHIVDLQESFVEEFIFPTLRASAQYEGVYLLATALSRPLITRELVRVAREEGCGLVAHGCIGKGNDQFRFETAVAALAPEIKIVAPRRLWSFDSLEKITAYARKHRLSIEDETLTTPFSVDRSLWGTRISGGPLEDPSVPAPDDVFQMTRSPVAAHAEPTTLDIEFEAGVPVALDGVRLAPVDLIVQLNRLAGEHGIGRVDHVENRILGMKVREVYEAPAATVLYAAHQQLEELTLDRETYHFKLRLSQKFADLVYQGFWFSELREALSEFFDRIQRYVTGTVTLRLFKGHVAAIASSSPYSLYSRELATIERSGDFDSAAADRFIGFIVDTNRSTALIHRRGGGEANLPPIGHRPSEANP